MFVGLLTDPVKGSNRTKCISLSNQKYLIQPTLMATIYKHFYIVRKHFSWSM